MTIYFGEIIEFYRLHKFDKPVGCSLEDIAIFEANIGFPLPDAYKDYLELMGMDYQGVMRGTDCFLKHINDNNDWLPDLLNENKVNYKLPKNYLTFFSHQGYIMSWFDLPILAPDPDVYVYAEGQMKEPELKGNFSNFMTQEILGMASICLKLRGK